MRLIDGYALCAKMYHDAFETDTDMQKWDSGCWIRYKMFENAIEDMPTVDNAGDLIDRIAEMIEGSIDHFDRDDAMDVLYEIKRILKGVEK